MAKQDQATVSILKALADPVRLKLVRSLADCSTHQKSCGDLSAKERLSQPAMSHHFSKLVTAGVVVEAKNGTQKTYALDTALLDSIGINVKKL